VINRLYAQRLGDIVEEDALKEGTERLHGFVED